jgi:hypothetical protein
MTDRQNLQLWAVLLVPPLTWAVHLETSYSLHPTACASNNRLMLVLVSIVALIPVAAMAWMALSILRSLPEPHPGGHSGAPEDVEPRPRGRARFMASAALGGSLLFALLIVGQTVPMLLLRPCD